MIAILLASVFAVSCALTGWIRRYCLAHGIVDVPNARSSHSRIVARGGGVGFSAIFLVVMLALGFAGIVPWRVAIGVVGGGAIIALTGWTDDRRGLSSLTRLALHLAAAVWVVLWIGPVPSVSLGPVTLQLGWPAQIITVLAIAWMVNLYNFMDGTDGIAAVEAVTVAALAGNVCVSAGGAASGHVFWLLGSAVAGFLVWNWPPARIFMGDAGSGFLGFAFAALTLMSVVENARLLWPCAILLSVFTADATTTLLRRMLKGERWFEPHRSHAYQKLSRRVGHRPIAIGVGLLNILLLGPAAWLAWLRPQLGFPLMLTVNIAFAVFTVTVRDRVDPPPAAIDRTTHDV